MPDNSFAFTVTDDTVHLSDFRQYESRGDLAHQILQALAADAPAAFEGKSGAVFYDDSPPDRAAGGGADLRFCTTKKVGEESAFLPFPCPHTVAWPQIGLDDADGLLHQLIAHDAPPESEQMFWIGADTHPSRVRLAELAREHPDIIEAEVMNWQRQPDGKVVSAGRQVSLWDHRKFKYLVDCPGYGYSGRLKWLLATGRPVFVVERPFVEHWHERMRAWEHFVPVKEDLSDLLEAHRRLEEEDGLYQTISAAGKKFAEENLPLETQIAAVVRRVEEG